METQLVFVRRQSPDWARLSHDFRAGRAIDPARFVPDHAIPGFPDDVAALIDHWNRHLSIDFFTFRAIVAAASSRSVGSIADAHVFHYEQFDEIMRFLRSHRAYVYFHDDDDFFSPDMSRVRARFAENADVIVTPLLRVGSPVFTFVREGRSADVIVGPRTNFHYRFQTNNYALNGDRIRTRDDFAILKDHVLAAAHADATGYSETLVDSLVGGTIKSPASASILPEIPKGAERSFAGFLRDVAAVDFPSTLSWITEPLGDIVRLTESILAESGVESVPDLLQF